MKITKTTYDGFIVVENNGETKVYEGYDICPDEVKTEINKNSYKERDCFWQDAI